MRWVRLLLSLPCVATMPSCPASFAAKENAIAGPSERHPLEDVANREKKMPRNYISRDGFGITDAARSYLTPLIAGEAYPEYRNGLPNYVRLKNISVPRKLKTPFKLYYKLCLTTDFPDSGKILPRCYLYTARVLNLATNPMNSR